MPLISKAQKIFRFITNKGIYRYGFRSLFRLRNLSDPPIIICGAPRSGTTLLISILDSHPEIIAIPFETQLFIRKRDKPWFPWKPWNDWFALFQLKAFLVSLEIKPEHRRWCEKTPNNVFYLEYIFSMFKQAKVIHIIRDGRDVVMSHHKQLGKFMTPQKWEKYVGEGLKFKDDPSVLTIRYEDLIIEFDKVMKDVSQFLGIENTFHKHFYTETSVDNNASIINGYGNKGIYTAKPISSDSLNKWKNAPDVIKAFNDYQPAKALLVKLGYEEN
jgi:hypothetical protein